MTARCRTCGALLLAAWSLAHAPECPQADAYPIGPHEAAEARGGAT